MLESDEIGTSQTRTVKMEGIEFRVVRSVLDVSYDGFWDIFEAGSWEPLTLKMIRQLGGPGTKFFDVGGWIGATAIWAASIGCDVLCFEPDPIALSALRANLDLNPSLKERVTVIPAAVGSAAGDLTVYASRFGISTTSMFPNAQVGRGIVPLTKSRTVPMVSLPDYIRSQEPQSGKSFIKIDIEGGEFSLLPCLEPIIRGYDIPVMVEMHPMSILSEDGDHILLKRIYAYASALEKFQTCHWYGAASDQFSKMSKTQICLWILNNLSTSYQLVISPSPLQQDQSA